MVYLVDDTKRSMKLTNGLKGSEETADTGKSMKRQTQGSFVPHRFSHQGKSHTLFKRIDSAEAPYYVHFQFDSDRYKRCLDTFDVVLAEARAKSLIDSVIAAKWLTIATAVKPQVVKEECNLTLADVTEIYTRVASIGTRTVKNNVLSMLKVIEKVEGKRKLAGEIPLTSIDKALASRFQDACLKEYSTAAAKDDSAQRIARERALLSSRSTIAQARSIFSSKSDQDLIERYAQSGVIVPACVKEFAKAKLRGKKASQQYRPASSDVIKGTFEAIETMKADRDVYVAFWFLVGAALRRKEVRNLRWEHVVMRDGGPWICGGAGKDGMEIQVPIQSKAFEAIKPFRKAEGFVIVQRSDKWARRLSKWMRDQGWQTTKTLHELRAYCGSLVYQKNPLAAMHLLRHKSIAVTEKHYCRYVQQSLPIDVL